MALGLLIAWTAISVAWWGLAFYPLEATPEWLARTREVCFGSVSNGLPDTSGWTMLIAAPLTMLGGLLAVWGDDVRAAWRRPAVRVVLMALVLTVLTGLAWTAQRVTRGVEITRAATAAPGPASEPLPSTYPRLDRTLPRFALVDQHGATVTPDALRGRTTLLTFAFAHCYTMCPGIMQTVSEASRASGADVVVITLDPWRDTPGSLPSLARAWDLGPGQRVLTGDPDLVEKVLDALDVQRSRDMKTGDVAHPGLVYVVAPDGHIAYAFNGAPAEWLAEGARRATAR